jgi:hypothetical protein
MRLDWPRLRSAISHKLGFVWPLRFPLLIGVSIRLLLAVYSAHEGDQFTFAAISLGQVFGSGPYASPNIYPPGWDLILGGLGRIVTYAVPPSAILFPTPINTALHTAIGAWEPFYFVSPAFVFSEKLILVVFDCATGILLYRLVLESKVPGVDPRWVFVAWFFNPLILWESAVHGDYDVVPTFFAVLGLCCIRWGRPGWTGLSLGISIILKLFALFLIPVALALLIRTKSKTPSSARSALPVAAIFLLGLVVPLLCVFWTPGLVQQYYGYAFSGASVGESYGGFWIWSFTSITPLHGVAGWLFSHSALVTEVSFAVSAILAVLVATIPFSSFGLKGESLLESSALFMCAICSSYFANAVVQPQYVIWLVPFMTIWAATKRSLLALMLTITLLAVAIDNLAVGPLYYWQALTYYFGVPSQSLLVSSSLFFYHYEFISYPLTFVPGFVAIVVFVLLVLRTTRGSAVKGSAV